MLYIVFILPVHNSWCFNKSVRHVCNAHYCATMISRAPVFDCQLGWPPNVHVLVFAELLTLKAEQASKGRTTCTMCFSLLDCYLFRIMTTFIREEKILPSLSQNHFRTSGPAHWSFLSFYYLHFRALLKCP